MTDQQHPTPPRRGHRMPDWWAPKAALPSPDAPPEAPAPAGPSVPVQTPAPPATPPAPDAPPAVPPATPAPAGPQPTGPVTKTAAPAGRRLGGPRVQKVVDRIPGRDNKRLRLAFFNGTAAGVGWWAGLVPYFGAYLPVAEQAVTGTLGTALALAGLVGGWKFSGHPAVLVVLPYAPVSRVVLAVGAAEFGRRLAPQVVDYLNEFGADYGLGADSVSLLLTGATLCGTFWWLIDRRIRTWWLPGRWLCRVPLASALLATALYGPGI